MSWKHLWMDVSSRRCARTSQLAAIRTIGSHCHVKHGELTFDVSRTSEHQSVPPSYGTAAGKHVV